MKGRGRGRERRERGEGMARKKCGSRYVESWIRQWFYPAFIVLYCF